MKPFDRLSGYLSALERRMRWLALTRGAAATSVAALALTVLAVIAANQFAFSHSSVVGARVFLFLGIAFAIAAALVVPLIRLNRRRAARAAETSHPDFEERLLTFTERSETHPGDPFLHLLAADALTVADKAEPNSVVKTTHLFGFSSAAVAAIAALLWIATFQGFLGYGTGLLWGSVPKGMTKAFYSINVTPGAKTVRKRSDQVIAAQLVGFTSPKVQLFVKYASTSQWEGADMRVEESGSAYQFLIAGVPESLEYYVEAGGVRSQTYKLNVVDLPAVKKVAVTFHYPAYLGLKDATEDPGGDLRAVIGTVGEVFVTFDKPLAAGEIVLDDGSKIALAKGPNNTLTAKVPIEKDGMYHVAAIEAGDDVRLSEDYFIEAMKDEAPEVSITRPGRDFRASPIEEVTVAVSAKDDFGLKDVALHYSVNGAPEKTVPLLQAKGAKESNGSTVLSLEDFKVEPGDVVSIYATANDARSTSKTDIFFIQAEPFERNYTQSQQDGGGAAGGGDQGGDEQNQISQRQKEIITATWNQEKGTGARGTDAENAAFLSRVQSKLREQAASLAQRMKSRELDEAGDAFKSFVADMEQAVAAMQPAADKLKAAKWRDALAPEQKALQYLLRAEDTFRDIQVSMGRQGGGGGGGGGGMNSATRDLEGLFDLELDTQKNQYESQSSSQSTNQQQQQVDDALQKLAELAKRQQELSEQQKRNPQSASQQRYEQEMLRREAEQLRQQLDQLNRQQQNQLSRDGQQSQQQSQQGRPGQAGQSGQSGQQGQMSQQGQQGGQSGDQQMQQRLGQMAQRGQQDQQNQQGQQQQQMGQDQRLRGASAEQLKKALDALAQAEQDMRNAQQQSSMQSDAEAKRAADRLNDAAQMLSNLRQQQSSNQLEQLAQQADQAARQQQQFEGDLRRAAMQGDGMTREQANQLADRHQAQVGDVKKLEQGMQDAVRDLMGTERQASNKLRQTLGDLEQAEIPRDMQRDADWIRRGMAEYAAMSEAQITAGLNELHDRMEQLRKEMAAGQQQKAGQDGKGAQDALNNVEQLRQLVEQRAAQLRGQNGQGQQQNGQQRQGQQLSRNGQQNGQPGQQAGQQGQQGAQPGQGGQQGAQGQQGGQPNGANNNGANNAGGYNGGNWSPQGGPNYNGYGYRGGYIRDQDIQQAYRNALQSLQQLQQQNRADPNAVRDWNNVIHDLRQFDPYALNNDPLLSERIQAALGNIEQAEMELRRKVDDSGGSDGSIRSPSSEPTPQGYGNAVAEYFRKLSKTGKQ